MADGHALNDDDRTPWLQALNDAVFAMQRTNGIIADRLFGAEERYRDMLRDGNTNLSFIYLQGDFALIESRLLARKGHFFKPQMLVSQFAALEEPTTEERDVFAIDISQPLDNVVADTLNTIKSIIA
ncbi:gluconokinase, GntK/IdnK-type [Edwardsiella ictaluri]